MPTYIFSTLTELITYLTGQIGPNGDQEITGQRHQDVVVTIAQSLVNIVASIPPTTVNQFPPYNAATVYTGGQEVVVRYAGKLWLFVSGSNQLAVTPGTNGLVWQELTAVQLAHFRNQDQMLDQGGPNEVTAAELKALLASQGSFSWKPPFDEIATTPPVSPESDVTWLVDVGATGAWSGEELSLAKWVLGNWQFTKLVNGDVTRSRAGGIMVFVTGGALVSYNLDTVLSGVPTLEQVIASGSANGSQRITLQSTINEVAITSNVSGNVFLNTNSTQRHRLLLSGDVTMDAQPMSGNTQFSIEMQAIGVARNITWASNKWSYASGAPAIPSTIPINTVWLFKVRSLDGRLHIESWQVVTPL